MTFLQSNSKLLPQRFVLKQPGQWSRRCVVSRSAAVVAEPVRFASPVQLNTSWYPKKQDTLKSEKDWYIIDAEGQRLGRLAGLVANYLRGKHLPTYTPSMEMGSMIVIVNAEKVTVTGRKMDQKLYRRVNVGRPGSMKVETFRQLQARIPERIIEKAVWGMLPKGRLGRKIKLNMKVYKGPEHPHAAQQPIDLTFKLTNNLNKLERKRLGIKIKKRPSVTSKIVKHYKKVVADLQAKQAEDVIAAEKA